MPNSYPYRVLLTALLLLSVAGCSTLATTTYGEQAELQKAAISTWRTEQQEAKQATKLTELLDLPALSRLIEEAMGSNPSLQQTVIALKIAKLLRKQSKGDLLPTATFTWDGNRSEDSDTVNITDLTVSWELDLWGQIRDGVDAADMNVASTLANLQASQDALAASIMRGWLQVSLQQQLIAIETSRLALLEENEAFILQRYRSGLGLLESLDEARTTSASTRATLAEYQQDLVEYQRELAQLLGVIEFDRELVIPSVFPQVLKPLAGLPEQDLGRRADLQSAFFDILEQQYQTDIAYKSLLPSLSLSASLTDAGSSLFTDPVWSLLGQLTAPLFQGGQLKAQAEIAELYAEQAYWRYQEKLLTAVSEVENGLGREQALTLQQQHISDALQSARRSETNYLTKYRQGLVDILDLLIVQQQTYNLQSQLAQLQYNRLNNRITLGLALGLGVSQ